MKKRTLSISFLLIITISLFSSCSSLKKETASNKTSVVTTVFAPYDFIRQIAGEHAEVTMLLPPGAESHSYEPTPQDIITIKNCDVFVYVGGDSDAWVAGVLDSIEKNSMKIVTLMDCVDLVEEETVEGMEPEEEKEESESEAVEYDEHVWTSPRNAIKIVDKITEALCSVDETNKDFYSASASSYDGKLSELDAAFKKLVASGKRKTVVFGDRFPLRYFVDAYGLGYYAAFPGCSTDTEPSAATVAFLIDKVKEQQIPVVFHIELSNEKMADTICEATGAKKLLFNACHNVSKKDFDKGVTYLDLMYQNVEALKEALN